MAGFEGLRLLAGQCSDPRAEVARLVQAALGPGARIEHGPDGEPRLAGVDHAPSVSVSHSRRVAALLLDAGRRPIGVDVEEWRDKLLRVAPRLLAPDEMEAWGDRTALLAAWTAKEAVYKAALTPGLAFHEIRLPGQFPGLGRPYQATARGRRYLLLSAWLGPDSPTLATVAVG